MDFKRALVLAPHTDDGEFGCGGTISRLVRQGCAVHYVAFSICEQSVPEGLPRDILATEVMAATAVLGIDADRVHVNRLPVRSFPEHRQWILEELIRLRREVAPELVLTPASFDVHQDHQVVHQESVRAFRSCCLLGYELPWNNLEFRHGVFVRLEEADLDRKQAAIACYESQAFRAYSRDRMFHDLAALRGGQCGHRHAEAFENLRWIL